MPALGVVQRAFATAAALVVCRDDGAGLLLAGNNKFAHGVILSGLSACGVVVVAFVGLIIRHFHDAVKQAKLTIIAMTFCAILSWT